MSTLTPSMAAAALNSASLRSLGGGWRLRVASKDMCLCLCVSHCGFQHMFVPGSGACESRHHLLFQLSTVTPSRAAAAALNSSSLCSLSSGWRLRSLCIRSHNAAFVKCVDGYTHKSHITFTYVCVAGQAKQQAHLSSACLGKARAMMPATRVFASSMNSSTK